MSRYSIVLLNDWRRVRNRHSGMTLLNISGDWLAGEWITGEVTVFGLGLTVTRWSRRPVAMPKWASVAAAGASIYGVTPAEGWPDGTPFAKANFTFCEDPWPEGVPVESLGREHGE